MPWIDSTVPPAPVVAMQRDRDSVRLAFTATGARAVRMFLVYRAPASAEGADTLNPSWIYREIPADGQKTAFSLPARGLGPGKWLVTEVTVTNMESPPFSLPLTP